MYKVYIDNNEEWFIYTLKFIFNNIPYSFEFTSNQPNMVISEKLSFLSDTYIKEIEELIGEDIGYVRYIYERISCYQESLLEKDGLFINSLLSSTDKLDYNYTEATVNKIVTIISVAFEEFVEVNNINIKKKSLHINNKKFSVCLTHDIDTLKPTFKTFLKQTRHALFRSIKQIKKGNIESVFTEISILFRKSMAFERLWNFDKIREIHKKYNVTSTYNFYSYTKNNFSTFKDKLYNPEYDISKNKVLLKEVDNIVKTKSEIQIHGSYSSSIDIDMLKEEKSKLEKTFNKKIIGIRQHFLQFSILNTPNIYEKLGFRYDTTLGFRDINGFRAGCALPFYLYNHKEDRATDVLEIPLVVMDGVLFDRDLNSYEETLTQVIELLTQIRDTGGVCSILWHNHVFDEKLFPNWAKVYQDTLKWIDSNEGWMGSCYEYLNDRQESGSDK